MYAGSHARTKPRTREGSKIHRFLVSSRRPLEMLPLVNIAATEMTTIAAPAPARGVRQERRPADESSAAPSTHERAGRGGFAPATRRGLLVVSWWTFLEKGVHPFHPVRVRHTIH